jgi:hypothetical protein
LRRAELLPVLLLAGCSNASGPHPELPRGTASTGPQPLAFHDASEASGLRFKHDAGLTEAKQLPETMGAGAAIADFNEDGHLDIYLVQSGPLPSGEQRSLAPPNQLWLGNGDGTFRDVTKSTGDGAHRGYGQGVSCGDYDGDGHLDLYVTNLGPDVLLRGDGRGSFEDRTTPAGLGDGRWNAGATFFDADADGDLDLYVTGYLDYDVHDPQFCGERKPGWRSYCHPDHYDGLRDRFWRNLGDGTFEDATIAAGLADSAGKGLGVVASDLDQDGDLDLYVANDSVENRLWTNRGDGTFEDGTLLSGTGVNAFGMTEAGMGLATGDLDGDGDIDLFVTNFDDESNTLYRNDGEGFFTDVTDSTGLEAPSRLPVGFGTVAADLDDDGDLDLAVANGHIIDNIQLYNDGKSWAQRPLLFEALGGGRFRDASEDSGDLCSLEIVGRGLYTGDLDEDGDLDLLLTENDGPARLFFNAGAAPQAIELHGLPYGTQVEFELADGERALREAGPQTSYYGASAPVARFGSGGVVALELRPLGQAPMRWIAPADQPLSGRWRVQIEGGECELTRL